MKVAAKTVVKFRVAKGAKDAILGAKAPSQAGKQASGAGRPRGKQSRPLP
jgi:hypothetical protein